VALDDWTAEVVPFFQHENRKQDKFQMSSLTIDDDWSGL
jgi:hypothetical protein